MFRGDEDCTETRAVCVLHLEDDSVVADGVSTTLQGEGWSVETCATGAAALEKLESGKGFDVLIFDNKLPDTTGIELIKQTRALAQTSAWGARTSHAGTSALARRAVLPRPPRVGQRKGRGGLPTWRGVLGSWREHERFLRGSVG